MGFTCHICGTEHYADVGSSRICDVCHQRYCYSFDPVADPHHHNCGPLPNKCDHCAGYPPRCTYGEGCKNELVPGENFPCKACLRPMCGDHMQTAEICEQCWNAGRRLPFVDAAVRSRGWNVK